jgi:multiple sugar transport system permease protein
VRPRPWQTLAAYAALCALMVFALGPFYWMLALSVRPSEIVFSTPPPLVYWDLTLDNYRTVIESTPFVRMFLNSLGVSIATTAVTLLFAAMAAHSLARLRFRGRLLISRGVLITYIFPQILLVVPLFVAMVNLRLANSYLGLVLTYLTFSFPFAMWMLTAYFQTIPVELEEAALIDGASRFTVFCRIVLPLAKPGIAAAGIFTFIHAWNEFLYALVLMNAEEKATLTIGLLRLLSSETLDWGAMLAATSMMVVPVVFAFLYYQRHLVSGLTAGATRG